MILFRQFRPHFQRMFFFAERRAGSFPAEADHVFRPTWIIDSEPCRLRPGAGVGDYSARFLGLPGPPLRFGNTVPGGKTSKST